jgi:hypothetical protein
VSEGEGGIVIARGPRVAILDAAEPLQDLRVPPGNGLEKLSQDREGQHSIRINEIVRGKRTITINISCTR